VHRAWIVLFAGGVALAGPPPKAVRKPAPADLPQNSLTYFVDGVMLDKAGDWDLAISRYRSAGSDVPAVVYNIADLQRRREDWNEAIFMYKKYLELAPDAPDRAAVQKLIEQLQNTPVQIVVDGPDPDGVVFIDGKPAGASPLVTSLADGEHVVERIGPTTYIHQHVRPEPRQHRHITGADREGNVVLSSNGSSSGSWRDGDKTFQMHERFKLPPGRVDTFYFAPGRACSPLSFDVPAEGLVYVFVDVAETKRGNCTPIKVTAQKIQFAGVKK
jgi:hypothetical protein